MEGGLQPLEPQVGRRGVRQYRAGWFDLAPEVAGHGMRASGGGVGLQHRQLGGAARPGVGAARVKAAAWRWRGGARHVAREKDALPAGWFE